MNKVLVVYTDRFSKRNIETSSIFKSLNSKFHVSTIDFESYSERPFLHKVISNPLVKILQYRFSEIHQFKKHLLKKKYKDLFQVNNYDKVDSKYGFPFSRSVFLYNFFYFLHKNLKSFFKSDFNPDLVLITGCQEGFSQYILKWSYINKIPAICLVNSWDHLTFRGPAYHYSNIKKFLVWGEIQKEELLKYHHIPETKITITGSPQFDYLNEIKKAQTSRSEIGLKDDEFVVFFPTYNERHGFNEPESCERLITNLNDLRIPFKIILRPYPKDTTFTTRFNHIINQKNILVNEIDKDFIADRRNLSLHLKHCDMVVCGPGTVGIEAMYFNKPLIFLAMETRPEFSKIDIAKERYYTDHLINVIIPGGSFFCDDLSQLDKFLKLIIDKKTSFDEIQRQILLKQIFSLEGNSSALILDEVLKVIN